MGHLLQWLSTRNGQVDVALVPIDRVVTPDELQFRQWLEGCLVFEDGCARWAPTDDTQADVGKAEPVKRDPHRALSSSADPSPAHIAETLDHAIADGVERRPERGRVLPRVQGFGAVGVGAKDHGDGHGFGRKGRGEFGHVAHAQPYGAETYMPVRTIDLSLGLNDSREPLQNKG